MAFRGIKASNNHKTSANLESSGYQASDPYHNHNSFSHSGCFLLLVYFFLLPASRETMINLIYLASAAAGAS